MKNDWNHETLQTVKKEKHRINNISSFQSPKEYTEYVEKRHREPNIFLFLPKMGLLGGQADDTKKSIMNYELLSRMGKSLEKNQQTKREKKSVDEFQFVKNCL